MKDLAIILITISPFIVFFVAIRGELATGKIIGYAMLTTAMACGMWMASASLFKASESATSRGFCAAAVVTLAAIFVVRHKRRATRPSS